MVLWLFPCPACAGSHSYKHPGKRGQDSCQNALLRPRSCPEPLLQIWADRCGQAEHGEDPTGQRSALCCCSCGWVVLLSCPTLLSQPHPKPQPQQPLPITGRGRGGMGRRSTVQWTQGPLGWMGWSSGVHWAHTCLGVGMGLQPAGACIGHNQQGFGSGDPQG